MSKKSVSNHKGFSNVVNSSSCHIHVYSTRPDKSLLFFNVCGWNVEWKLKPEVSID